MRLMTPLGDAACFVHVTVMFSAWLSAPGAELQVFANDNDTGDGDLVTFHMWSVSCVAAMVLFSDCGVSSFGLIDTALVPMPCVPSVPLSSARLACSDEPG